MKNCESILGKKILEIREIKGISQQQLALKAGLSKALITHIETGKRYPSDKALQKIKMDTCLQLIETYIHFVGIHLNI